MSIHYLTGDNWVDSCIEEFGGQGRVQGWNGKLGMNDITKRESTDKEKIKDGALRHLNI